MSYLDRYVSGQHKKVWDELLAKGSLKDSEAVKEAEAVAQETMQRVKRNIEKIIERLKAENYRFQKPNEARVPPGWLTSWNIKKLEKLVGPVPLSIKCFYRIVGTVNLNGSHPSWSQKDYPDPLMIDTPIGYFPTYAYREWKEMYEEPDRDKQKNFRMELAPDYYHKANVSGGSPYSVELPNGSADCRLLGEKHKTSFVNYLRVAFKWGGFPGFERSKNPPRKFISELTEGLEPI